MKTMIVIVSAFVLLSQAVAADRPDGGPGRGPSPGHANGRMMIQQAGPYSAAWIAEAGLRLTEEQADRIRALEEKWTRQIEPLQDRLYETRKELKAEWLRTESDRRRIEILQDEASRLHERMREKLAGRRAEVLEGLTAEQRSRLAELEQKRGERHDRVRYQGDR